MQPTDSDSDIDDTEGLQRAYSAPSRIYRKKDTLYIAGTKDLSDVTQDWIKIPFHRIPDTTRYRTANKFLDSPEGQGIDRFVGHSLGAVVAGELEKNRNIKSTQYGAPVLDIIPRNPFHHPDRVACRFDPVAFLDFGAKKVDCPDRINTHSYKGLEKFRKFSFFSPISFF
jgi:hypothetical protein